MPLRPSGAMTPVTARRSQRYSLTVWKSTERSVPSAVAALYALRIGSSLAACGDETPTVSPAGPDCTVKRSRKGLSEWL